jgi:sugar phosphate isomerase/epimerase
MKIRVGTLVGGGGDPAGYIKQILPHGFESFSITFWQSTEGVDWKKMAKEVHDELDGSDAVISSLAVFGNPLENLGLEWEPCHQLTYLIDPMPQLREWAPRIFHMHGKDASVHWNGVRRYGIYHSMAPDIAIEGWHDPVYRGELEMTGQVHALNYLKECRGGSYVPNPTT